MTDSAQSAARTINNDHPAGAAPGERRTILFGTTRRTLLGAEPAGLDTAKLCREPTHRTRLHSRDHRPRAEAFAR